MTKKASVRVARQLGVDMMFCVEHDKLSTHERHSSGLTLVNGIELAMSDSVHLILYNVSMDQIRGLEVGKRSVSYHSLLRFLEHEKPAEALFSIPHPFRVGSGFLKAPLDGIKKRLLEVCDVVEVVDGKAGTSQNEARQLASLTQNPTVLGVAAVDAHEPANLLTNYASLIFPNSASATEYLGSPRPRSVIKVENFVLTDRDSEKYRKTELSLPALFKRVPLPIVKVGSLLRYHLRRIKFRKVNIASLVYEET
jgi:hypothetical protein